MQPTKTNFTVLVAEDEMEVRSYVELALRRQGYLVELVQDGEEAIAFLRERSAPVAVVLLDIVMPRKDGIETLKEIRALDKDLPVIMLSGVSNPLTIVEAMKNGATDFLPKPASHEDLRRAIKHALERQSGPPAAPEPPAPGAPPRSFFGNDSFMKDVQALLPQIGWSEAPVLIQGETGVGKEVLARELHAHSPRAKKPFLKLNCAALPTELVESELFGYERGAFTGAIQKKPGMFEQADGGTILLDEIGDMDVRLQAKLLQVLQDHEFQRLGGKETVKVDVRVLAATHRDLERAIAENSFREDLYYRLNVISLLVPALRDRRDDILPLAEFLIRRHLPPKSTPPALTPELKSAFLEYDWPGNVRELENVIRRFLILQNAEMIVNDLRRKSNRKNSDALVQSIEQPPPPAPAGPTPILEHVKEAKNRAERTAILAALQTTHWNRKQAAALLKIDYKALLYKMKKLRIEEKMIRLPAERVAPAAAAGGEEKP
jgi:two-component system response regulator AtoC